VSKLSLTSVVIPTYNRAEFLPHTVESALGQEGAEVEVIVIDDGSTDDTASVVERLSPAWGERFRYVRQENAERCVARNHGLRHARGEFVAFMDSDDLWRPNHVAACVEALRRNPSAVAAYGEHGLVDAGGRVIEEHVVRPAYEGDDFRRALCLKRLILHPTEVLVRRSALEGTGEVFDPEIPGVEDWLAWAGLARRGQFARVGQPTAWRRLHPGGTWGDPEKFARNSSRGTEKLIALGLPEEVGLPPARVVAINQTHCAYGFYLAGDWPRAWGWLRTAAHTYPPLVGSADFWRVAARLLVGKKLSRRVRESRQRARGAEAQTAGHGTAP
jgi:glycosyltransferase involved in cell wall biosynthesis